MSYPPDEAGRHSTWHPDELPDLSPGEPTAQAPTFHIPALPRKFQGRLWLHLLLFVLTLGTTTAVGAFHYHSFASEFGRIDVPFGWGLLVPGLWYSLTLLTILGAHEMGHYLFCRRYNIDASLPYFIPAPVPLTGTLGAVIKIREAFPTRTVLFDIGVAGPIAGFAIVVPALFLGLSMSHVVPVPVGNDVFFLGEPLLFRAGVKLVFGTIQDGYTVNMHPMMFASWFGMLATALNLLPFGQLDGGHITYATMKRLSMPISLATVATAVVMTWFTSSWMFLTMMMIVMLFLLGPRHPRVVAEWEPLARSRYAVAVLALIILILCFTPVPIALVQQP
ncbi:MAG TPA: site-2 protease family protein [Vicinamibacterales bacterium]|nr:site-2 protease family protein [Vicinamibacterales bacterium]